MDIMELGAIGELVGGVAVIVSLIYVGLQVRQANKAGSRESYRTWVSEMNKVWFFAPEFFMHADRLLSADGCLPPLHHSMPWYAAAEAR